MDRTRLTLKDAVMRQQHFLNGFAAEMTRRGHGLPDEMFGWILNESRSMLPSSGAGGT